MQKSERDEFKEFVTIEKELGAIPLGFEKPPPITRPINPDEKPPTLWAKLAEVLDYGPGKMQ